MVKLFNNIFTVYFNLMFSQIELNKTAKMAAMFVVCFLHPEWLSGAGALTVPLMSLVLLVYFLPVVITGSPSLVQSPQKKLLEEGDSTVKSWVFLVCQSTFPLGRNCKVWDLNECYLSLRFESRDPFVIEINAKYAFESGDSKVKMRGFEDFCEEVQGALDRLFIELQKTHLLTLLGPPQTQRL